MSPRRRVPPILLGVLLGWLASSLGSLAIEDPKLVTRQREREQMVQTAGKDRALSKEMPAEIQALPVVGEIEWRVDELPFVPSGPHAGISGSGVAVVDGKIYLAGGFIPAGDGTSDLSYRTSRWAYVFDPATQQWTRLPDLPARLEYTRAIGTEHAVYVVGGAVQGRPTRPSDAVFKLDVRKTPLKWESMPPLSVARSHVSADRIENLLIVAGGNRYDIAEKGYSAKTIQGITEVLDLGRAGHGWESRMQLPGAPRGWSATAVVGKHFYMLGGVTWTTTSRVRLQESLRFDPQADRWEKLADFPIAISGWEGDVYGDRWIILAGGASRFWNDIVFAYDTQENRWFRFASPLPPGGLFNDPGVCIIDDTLYVVGSEGPGGSHFSYFLSGKIKLNSESHTR